MIGTLVTYTNRSSEQLTALLESNALDQITRLQGLGILKLEVDFPGDFDLEAYLEEGKDTLRFIADKVETWKEPLTALHAFFTLLDLAGDTAALTSEAMAGVANLTGIAQDHSGNPEDAIEASRAHLLRLKNSLPAPEELDEFQQNLRNLEDNLDKLKQLV